MMCPRWPECQLRWLTGAEFSPLFSRGLSEGSAVLNSDRRCVVETMRRDEMDQLEGGGMDDATICGFAAGLTFAAFFFGGPVLGLYTTSKAIGACAIALALH
jgi:hypothetical protein